MCTQPTHVIRFSRQTQGRVHSANGRLARFVIMLLISFLRLRGVYIDISKTGWLPRSTDDSRPRDAGRGVRLNDRYAARSGDL